MVDQYDQLYSKRFGVFLSEVSENKLREISLNHEWTFEKLRQHVTRSPQDKSELHLFMLSGVPDAVFDLTDLEILKLELIPEARITAKISQMTNLQELHFYHCPAKVEQTAFIFLRDHLRCLLVKFTDVAEIPSWVYMLRNLRELYLVGNLNSENNKMIGLESMRDLRHLKVLQLKSNLTKIPTNITDLSPHLIKLVVHNDGTKLLVLNSLKKMMNLAVLELLNCELERIPHAIFSLTNLQDLDLKSNNICTIEEIISFQHLKRLTCLKLWHNKIVTIPVSISHVKNLECLYLSHNKLEALPSSLFTLLKLRYLDVSHNSVVVIPLEVGLSAEPPTFRNQRQQSGGGSEATVQVRQTEELVSQPQLHRIHSRKDRPAFPADPPGTEGELPGSPPPSAQPLPTPAQKLPDSGGPSLRLAAPRGERQYQSGKHRFFSQWVQVSE
ncbi:hypothetical protein fugu_005935 [Takifugu bimaculatus]|uniref:Uncharacterized protein n=1 Tax=Takifugu bimaculatus TaxID=433685 RepID=A0A4Z2B5R5_9TELE|nr:hypothetical protein fugu_005935 [Takifugu bimaculatus]